MVIDTSALLAILDDEPERRAFNEPRRGDPATAGCLDEVERRRDVVSQLPSVPPSSRRSRLCKHGAQSVTC